MSEREGERLRSHYLLGKKERQKLVYFLIRAAMTTAGKTPRFCPQATSIHLNTQRRSTMTTFSPSFSAKLDGKAS